MSRPTRKTGKDHQIVFPLKVLLSGGSADAICDVELCDVERDVGACCWLDGTPRYVVRGEEHGDFKPTIPSDLYKRGWRWFGGLLSQLDGWAELDGQIVTHEQRIEGQCVISIGFPIASLDEIWTRARKLDQARDDLRAARERREQIKTSTKSTRSKPQRELKRIAAAAQPGQTEAHDRDARRQSTRETAVSPRTRQARPSEVALEQLSLF